MPKSPESRDGKWVIVTVRYRVTTLTCTSGVATMNSLLSTSKTVCPFHLSLQWQRYVYVYGYTFRRPTTYDMSNSNARSYLYISDPNGILAL